MAPRTQVQPRKEEKFLLRSQTQGYLYRSGMKPMLVRRVCVLFYEPNAVSGRLQYFRLCLEVNQEQPVTALLKGEHRVEPKHLPHFPSDSPQPQFTHP